MDKKTIYRLKAANLPGRKYMDDKPEDCAYCYWWKPGKKCCERKECYYLLPLIREPVQKEAKLGECRNCPYGKYTSCIGYCIVKLLHENPTEI